MDDLPPFADDFDDSDSEIDDPEGEGVDMNNNNNDGNDEIPEGRRIQDFETWLAHNTLRDDEGPGDASALSPPPSRGWNLDRRREWLRIQEHEQYQREMHERFFGAEDGSNNDNNNDTTEGTSAADRDRRETLRRFESRRFAFLARASVKAIDEEDRPCGNSNVMSSTASTNSMHSTLVSSMRVDDFTVAVSVPLRPVAEVSETVFVAASRHSCHQLSPVSDDATRELYPESAVSHLLQVLLGERTVDDTPDHCAVDCCRLAHYLQHSTLVDAYGAVLTNSVDPENCLSLLHLSERLGLPSLWEKSLQQVLDTMDQVELCSDDVFMTSELRGRIKAIQTAIRSSVHGPTCVTSASSSKNPNSRLFFSSVQEYVSIFAERVQYFRERLADAKAQRDELLGRSGGDDENHRDNRNSSGDGAAAPPQRGRFVVSSSRPRDAFFEAGLSRQYSDDLQAKIERQEKRVKTLEIVLDEHKKLLLGSRPAGRSSY